MSSHSSAPPKFVDRTQNHCVQKTAATAPRVSSRPHRSGFLLPDLPSAVSGILLLAPPLR